jgi:flavin-dependent dehydrogenase
VSDPEVIIVGSGPAGCSTALHLVAQSPAWRDRILVLESKQHPRRKLCGGGVTVFGLQHLRGLGLELGVPRVDVREAHFRMRGRVITVRGDPLLSVVERTNFDHWLVQVLRTHGVRVVEQSPVQRIVPSSCGVKVHTAAHEFNAQVVVLASGSRSLDFVEWEGRCPGAGPRWVARALEVFATDPLAARGGQPASVEFDFSPLARGRYGYRWKFPMPGEHAATANYGVFDSRRYAQRRAPDLNLELSTLVQASGAKNLEAIQGYPIRLYSPLVRLSAPRMLLVGDAAGTDPFFGEGIGVSLAYGRLAAREIDQAWRLEDFGFTGFAGRVRGSDLGDYLGVRWASARFVYGLSRLPGFTHLAWTVAHLIARGYHPRLAG